ncbi:unnamed protein product [Fraxinus pennsylvanica]|uniref:AAA+ ATPase domain-containing protein n=1 Tax=Fraxinus pennsylvanica TaxID=56036 RepID=A0AAD2A1J0_9LAMI|nr:unnamed protein product [Fraxinus pennsylvanica]
MYMHLNIDCQRLRGEVKNLENKRKDVQLLVDAAKRNAQVIGSEVDAWLQKVDDLKKVACEVLNGSTNSQMRCLYLNCPNLKSRYSLSRKAVKKTADIVELKAEGELRVGLVGYPAPPVQIPYQNLHDFEGFETRISIKNKIMEALKDKDIGIIGIYGMAGVGKTTMVNEIVAQVKVEKLFGEVAMALVSQDQDLINVQDQLAEMLGLKIEEKTNKIVRAGRLHERLAADDDKSILVVLDDVWKEIDLTSIGIPPEGDDKRKGLKILFTSRNYNVWRNMGPKTKFEVNVLTEGEGLELFKHAADISDDTTDVLKGLAEQIANECGGLPLALVAIGETLGNREEHAWRNALEELRSSRVTNVTNENNLVYSAIELSYKYLQSDEAKLLLLLCSLFAEDQSISIERLVIYAKGLFKNTTSLSKTRDKVKTIVDKLKSCYLLLSGKEEEDVKLHDVVRDVCLSIASKGEHVFMVRHAGVTEWPEQDTDELYTAMSLTFNGMHQFPSGLKCGNLKLLRVRCQRSSSGPNMTSTDFFEDMKELRILDFIGMSIPIPSSIQLLTELRTLCLDSCEINFDLSMIGSLKKLEILTFFDSSIYVRFPSEMAQLGNLRSLDLRIQKGSHTLPPGVFSGMKKLEELYLGDYFQTRDEERMHIIEEVSSLTSLNTFQISTDDSQFLMQLIQALCLEKLERFQVIRTKEKAPNTKDYHVTRSLHLLDDIDASMLLEPGLKSLMRRTDHLFIEEAKVWKNLSNEFHEHGFINLKTLKLLSCDFEYLIDATISIPTGMFVKLELLELEGLHNLIEICNGHVPMKHLLGHISKPSSFSNLVTLKIDDCDAIRNLFRESVAKCMGNLQILCISRCEMLKEVVSPDTEQNEVTDMLEFPKLREIMLRSLKSFKSFRSESNKVGAMLTLFNQVMFPNMKVLEIEELDTVKIVDEEMHIRSLYKLSDVTVRYCDNLLTFAQSDSIKLLQNLKRLQVRSCKAVEVLFDIEGLKIDKDEAEISILDRLYSLRLDSLPSLLHITRMVAKGICVFQNLTSIDISECDSLRYLFSPSVAKSLVALQSLWVNKCEALEGIIGGDDETTESKMLEFPRLNHLTLVFVRNFKSFKCKSNCVGVPQTLFNQVCILSYMHEQSAILIFLKDA